MVLEVLSTLHPELHVGGRKPGSILWLTFSSCRDIRSSQASEEMPVPNPGDSAVFALFFLLTWKHLTWSETSKGYFLLYFPSLHSNACAPPPPRPCPRMPHTCGNETVTCFEHTVFFRVCNEALRELCDYKNELQILTCATKVWSRFPSSV